MNFNEALLESVIYALAYVECVAKRYSWSAQPALRGNRGNRHREGLVLEAGAAFTALHFPPFFPLYICLIGTWISYIDAPPTYSHCTSVCCRHFLLGYQNLEQMLIYLPHLLDRLPHLLNTAKACSMENISASPLPTACPPHPLRPSTPICLFSQTLSDDWLSGVKGSWIHGSHF